MRRKTFERMIVNGRVGWFAAAAYIVLGAWVAHREPNVVDRSLQTLIFGRETTLAWVLTLSGTLPIYLVLAVCLALVGWKWKAWRSRVALSLALTPSTWCVSDLGKAFFGRPRPEHWLMHHETSPSYASGHAALALVSYGLWAWFLWRSDLSPLVRRCAVFILIAWTIGIGWSRIALGAHYPTDVIGGYLLGAAMLSAAFACFPTATAARAKGTPASTAVDKKILKKYADD